MLSNYWHPKGTAPDSTFVDELRARASLEDIDALKLAISKRMEGRRVNSFSLKEGTFVYRARKLSDQFSKEKPIQPGNLSYPPAAVCSMGRLNRAGHPVFYCSTSKSPLLYELDAAAGDEFLLSIWKLRSPALVNNIGYTKKVFKSLGSSREPQMWGSPEREAPQNCLIPLHNDYLSDLFAEKIDGSAEERYKLSVAIAEIHYGLLKGKSNVFAGVLYPTVAGKANGDNLALLPWYVDSSLQWMKTIHFRVTAVQADSWPVEELDSARSVDDSGSLVWADHSPQLILNQPGATVKCVFKAGVDPLGDYIHGKDGIVGHWECSNSVTGKKHFF